jgi:adenosine deaminase
MNGLAISPFIAALPKVELHIHIEGTLQPSLRWALAKRNNIPLPYETYEALVASYAITLNHRPELNGRQPGVPSFLEAYFAGCEVLRTEDDFYDLAMAYLSRCKEMNVRYVEPFFDIQAHTRRGVPAEAVLDGYLRAQKDGAEQYGVQSNWILCFLRDESLEAGLAAYDAARPWSAGNVEGGKGLFHAVGLASNAYERPPMLFEEGFRRARADGLHVTMHCDFGQKDTHAHVREAIFEVCESSGAERIDHGLDAEDEEALWKGLKDRGIGLTLCPHAYHRRTKTEVLFPKIRRLWERGVTICVNSDDPVYMHDVWIDGNMQKVFTYCAFTKQEMVQLARNGVDMCWAKPEVKDAIYRELDVLDLESFE